MQESARNTIISQQLATIPEFLGLTRIYYISPIIRERSFEVTLSPRSALPASSNHVLPSIEIATFLRVEYDEMSSLWRENHSDDFAEILERYLAMSGIIESRTWGIIVHGNEHVFMWHRTVRERNTCLEIRKREIVLRGGTRDYTQEELELCRYCHVVRSRRELIRSSY